MRRVGLLAATAALVAACAGGGSSSPSPTVDAATASPAASASAESPGPSPSAAPTPAPPSTPPTPTPVPVANCAPEPMTVHDFTNGDPNCVQGREVTIRGWLADPPAMGWEGPGIQPAWLAYPPGVDNTALWQLGPGGAEMCDGGPDCSWLFIHVAPDSKVSLPTEPGWFLVTGHNFDPVAETCHFVYDEPMTEPTPPDSYARDACRGQLVVTAIRPAP